MRQVARACAPALVLLACSACTRGQGSAPRDARLEQLERRVAQLEERLAALPADESALRAAEVDELILRLDSGDIVDRYRAIRELTARGEDIHPRLALSLHDGTPRQREGIAAVFASNGTSDLLTDLLAAHAEAQRAGLRAFLVTALGRTGRTEAVDVIALDLAHESARVRIAAALALGQLQDAKAAPALLLASLTDDPVTAPLARTALRGLPDPALDFLLPGWTALGPRQRVAALDVIAGCSAEGTTAFLVERLRDASPLVALAAASALAQQGGREGLALAQERLRSDDAQVARAARDVIDLIERWPGR